MRGSEEDALDPGLADGAQKLGEARGTKAVTSVGVNILTKQRDLAHSGSNKSGDLVDDLFKRTALLASAHIWNDTVRAEVVASGHDRYPGMIAGSTMPGHIRSDPGIPLDATHATATALEHVGDEIADVRDGIGAEDDVDVVKILKQTLTVALRDAAADGYDTSTGWGRRQTFARGALAVQARIRSLADAARHEDDDIGVLGTRNLKASEGIKKTADALRIMKIHLATECADEICLAVENGILHNLPDSKIIVGDIERITGMG